MTFTVTQDFWNTEYKEPKSETVTEFADRCRECGAKYGKLLKQEPCEDCISRAQALSDYADWFGYGYRDNSFYKHLKNMPSIQPKTGHWIPVSERLPEDDGLYLVYTEEQPFVCSFKYRTFFIDEVLAWMPLPKPYKPQESEEV